MIVYMLLCLVAFVSFNHSQYFFKVTSFLRSLQFEDVSFHFGCTVNLSK